MRSQAAVFRCIRIRRSMHTVWPRTAAGCCAAAAALSVGACSCEAVKGPSLHANRLNGRVALVTGGASGIGKAICVELAKEGAKVVVLDTCLEPIEKGSSVLDAMQEAREQENLPETEETLSSVFVHGSVENDADVAAAVKAAVENFGRLDILVNNAAILQLGGPLLSTVESEWDETFGVNVKGVMRCCLAAAQQFLRQSPVGEDGIRGRIVNIASQHGIVYCPGNLAYGTSKAAVAYMTKQIACEYVQQGIIVNAVAPGRILTGRPGSRVHAEAESKEEQADLRASVARTPHAAIRLGKPEDVAKAVAFLAGDQASYIVGHVLVVDGGYTAA
eukprot:6203166-Pleurochrysis_carterae.AAC.1